MNIVQFTPKKGEIGGRRLMMERIAKELDAEIYTFGEISSDTSSSIPKNYNDFKQTVDTSYEINVKEKELSEADLIIGHSALTPIILSHIDTKIMVMNHGYFKELTTIFEEAVSTVDNTHEFLLREDIDKIRELAGKVLSKADILVANSKHVQTQLKKWFDLDSIVIYDPMDWEFYHPTDSAGDYFLWVGRQYWLKRPEVTLKAFDGLDEELHIAGGTGPYSDEIGAYSHSRNNVTYHGQLGKESLRELYNGANALIHTSYDEDCPGVIREAMACGTPTIAVDIPANREVMQETGVLCDNKRPVDSIKQEVQSFEQQTTESELREKAELFSQESFSDRIEEVVRNTY